MKKELNPAVLIGAGIAGVVALVLGAMYFMTPHPPPVTLPPAGMQDEGSIKRENVRKSNPETPPAEAAKPASGAGSGRTGD
jgi:hypothetical protein